MNSHMDRILRVIPIMMDIPNRKELIDLFVQKSLIFLLFVLKFFGRQAFWGHVELVRWWRDPAGSLKGIFHGLFLGLKVVQEDGL